MGKPTILALDFNNVLYSHYYAPKLTNSKGNPVQAIKGFMFRMKNLREMFNPDYIVIAHDVSRMKTFRRKLYPQYKANRKKTDPDFTFQAGQTLRLLSLLGFPLLSHEEYEADDVLGMVSRLGDELKMNTILVSADKDLYQLVTDRTVVWSFRDNQLIDKQYMLEHYRLTPNQWVDFKILKGDKSDNIIGIEGIGDKTALQLIQGFHSIPELYNNITKLSRSLQLKLLDGRDVLQLTRTLVTIVTDYKLLNLSEDSFKRKEVFMDEVYQTIHELEIPSLMNTIRYDLIPSKQEFYGPEEDY